MPKTFGIGREARQVDVPAVGEFALLHSLDLVGQVGVFGAVPFEAFHPGYPKALATLADAGAEVLTHTFRDELGVLRPAIAALCQTDLFDSLAARHGRRWYRAYAARRSQYGYRQ